jgi:hypothetical protein
MLMLVGTKVSDAGLVHLKALTRLQWLHLRGPRISHEGVQEFQQALPKVDIIRAPSFDSVFLDRATPELQNPRNTR